MQDAMAGSGSLEALKRDLDRISSLSAADVAALFDSILRRIHVEPQVPESWQLLVKIVKHDQISWRKINGHAEKLLVEAIEQVVTSEICSNDASNACEVAWQSISTEMGFRPKTERLVALISQAKRLNGIVLDEFKRALEAESDRKAFELVCLSTPLFATLLIKAVNDEHRSVVTEILSWALFRSDDENDIVVACKSPRMQEEAKNRKKTNQNNWRSAFWSTAKQLIEDSSVPSSSFSLLCDLHRRVRPDKHVFFWFEMLFICLESSMGKPGIAHSEIVESLLHSGVDVYQPTVNEDFESLKIFFEKLICAKDIFIGKDLVKVVSAGLTLDYRVVEPHFGVLVGDSLCPGVYSKSEMMMVICESLLATRRFHMFIDFASNALPKRWIQDISEDDLRFQSSLSDRLALLLETKLIEHQTPIIWKAFEAFSTEGIDVILEHEFLLCLLEAFVSSLNPASIGSETSIDKVSHAKSVGLTIIRTFISALNMSKTEPSTKANTSKRVRFEGTAIDTDVVARAPQLLSALRLIRSSTIFHSLIGFSSDEDVDCMEACKELFSQLSSSPEPMHRLLCDETCHVLVACLGTLEKTNMDGFVSVGPSSVASILKTAATRHGLHSTVLKTICDGFWSSIFDHKSDADEALQIMNRSFLYEIKEMADSFVDRFEANFDEQMVVLLCQLPRGFLSHKHLKRIIATVRSARLGNHQLAQFIASCILIPSEKEADHKAAIKLLKSIFPVAKKDDEKFACVFTDFLVKVDDDALRESIACSVVSLSKKPKLINACLAALKVSDEARSSLALLMMRSLATRAAFPGAAGPIWRDAATQFLGDLSAFKPSSSANAESHLNFIATHLMLKSASCATGDNETVRIPESSCFDEINSLRSGLEIVKGLSVTPGTRQTFLISACRGLAMIKISKDSELNKVIESLVELVLSSGCNEETKVELFRNVSSDQFLPILESILADCWGASPEKRHAAAINMRLLLSCRISKENHRIVTKRARAILAGACRLVVSEGGKDDLAWEPLMVFFASRRLRDSIKPEDFVIVLTATATLTSPRRIRLLQLVVESRISLVADVCSGAFVRAVACCERDIVFNERLPISLRENAALELARLCAALSGNESAFKHLALGILADHITLIYYKPVPSDSIKRQLDLLAYALLGLCGDRELQQLHAVLGGGAGGARREVLKRLVEEYKKNYAFRGKI